MQIYQASCFKMIQTMKKISFLWFVSSHKKGTLLTSFHIHSLLVFHTDLQKNTIVTYILTEQNHILSNMQDRLLQIMQLIQYPHVSSFSTVITNEFIGEDFYQVNTLWMVMRLWDLVCVCVNSTSEGGRALATPA